MAGLSGRRTVGWWSCVLLLFGSKVPNGQAADLESPGPLTGRWELSWSSLGETNVDRMQLTQRVSQVTGRFFGGLFLDGTLIDNKLEGNLSNQEGKKLATLSGTAAGEQLSGVFKMEARQFEWSARKVAPHLASTPKIHEFQAERYYNHFSGTIPPVLRVEPGDTIRTETVDAGGFDKNHVQRAPGGNPLTGPFYVAGAVRGDTLIVHFNRIRLNRDSAMSGTSIEASALEPGYGSDNKSGDDLEGDWRLDRDKGVATLAKPTEKLKGYSVPLQPMLGCVGVAPARRQSIGSGDLGSYGGNMDYNQVKEGVTLYLPVFTPGGLLFVGDGHAAEGDGELTGDALETSMDVEFTVDLLVGKHFNGPVAEDADYLMAFGIAGSLNDALQRATTGLARWLEDDFQLSHTEVAMVLGFSMRYDIAEVVDPHVHVVAKVKKSALAHLKRATAVTESGRAVF